MFQILKTDRLILIYTPFKWMIAFYGVVFQCKCLEICMHVSPLKWSNEIWKLASYNWKRIHIFCISFQCLWFGICMSVSLVKWSNKIWNDKNEQQCARSVRKPFCSFSVGVWYLYVPPLKEKCCVNFWYLFHQCLKNSFTELTFLWSDFHGQWLTHTPLMINTPA